jgi:hypothetical protein
MASSMVYPNCGILPQSLQISGKHDTLSRNDSGYQALVKGDLRKLMKENALPVVAPVPAEFGSKNDREVTQQALAVLQEFNAAVATDDSEAPHRAGFLERPTRTYLASPNFHISVQDNVRFSRDKETEKYHWKIRDQRQCRLCKGRT